MATVQKKTRQVRYALVGVGNIVQKAVVPAFKHASENSQLVALVSSTPEKRSEVGARTGVKVAGDYDALEDVIREANVDAVYLATPNAQHRGLAQRAMRAGAHVLCEKPMSVSSEDCRAMLATAEDTGRLLMVAYRLHFDQCSLEAIELARSGKLGELRAFSSVFTHSVRAGDIRTRADTGGGALFDLGPYPLNMARHLFDAEPIEVCAFQSRGHDRRSEEVDEMTTAVLRFPGERLAQFCVGQGEAAVSNFRVIGTEGDLRVEPAYEYAEGQAHHLTLEAKTRSTHFPRRDQFAPELLHFSECILEGKQPVPDGEEGLADVTVLEALAFSATIGRAVKLPPARPPRRLGRELEQHKPPVGRVKTVQAPSPAQR